MLSLALRKKGSEGFVIDKSYGIRLKDIETYYKKVDFNDDSVKDYFADSVINPYTMKFFMSMDEKFKDSKNLEDNLVRARQYLYSVMSSENADALFGASVKAQEYPLRRGAIIGDRDLYGADKEKKLKELNREMWGHEANSVEGYTKPYTRCQEKLTIYQKDLSELRTDEQKQARIKQFREEIFTPDQVTRLDEVDRIIADEQKKEENYKALESSIRSNPNFDRDEKEQKIRELQDRTFGEEADAYRRRQAIERGMEQIKK